MKIHPQKNTLLQAAQGNAETKACKRVFFSAAQEKLFPSPSFFIFFSHAQTPTQTGQDSISIGSDLTTLTEDRRAADNKGLPQWGLTCFVETFVQVQTVVLRMNSSANNPPLRQAPNRYRLL